MLETNIYPITNAGDLAMRYRFARVIGLRSDQAEYFQNRSALERKLSFELKAPVLFVERDSHPFLVLPSDVKVLPAEVALTRAVVSLELEADEFELDHSDASVEAGSIALRFLRFYIQAPLFKDSRLWQSASGRPFFPRTPTETDRGIDCFTGFAARPILTEQGVLGLCVDPVNSYVSSSPLPTHLTRDRFAALWRNRRCIYRFGSWYEIKLHGYDDRSVSAYRFRIDGRIWTLLDYVLARTGKPHPKHVANLDEDAAVVLYLDSRDNELGAPAPLCYPVYNTSDERVASLHRRAIMRPDRRREKTRQLVDKYLRNLTIGGVKLDLADKPLRISRKVFDVPDTIFGKGRILSVGKGRDAVKLNDLGSERMRLLQDRAAGFFDATPLDRHHLILPRSVADTFGPKFQEELATEVDRFLGRKDSYRPDVFVYDDRGQRTFVRQAIALRTALAQAKLHPGYALVMVHHATDRPQRGEDQLAAMVVQELRDKHDVVAAVVHSRVAQHAYKEVRDKNGHVQYHCARDQRQRLRGYVRNVALSKVLLTHQRWPFILASQLNADLTVGIDVKCNTCGFLVVGAQGREIRSMLQTSRQKERLLEDQTFAHISRILEGQRDALSRPVDSLVIHRDGRSWPSEIAGIQKAFVKARAQGIVAPSAKYAVVEISKTAPVHLRLFDIQSRGSNREFVGNPPLGSVCWINATEAYVCSTGYPLLTQGTAHPLHLRKVAGDFPFDACVADVYALTTLTWTQPRGCMRQPITISLNDRVLSLGAGEYDSDALDFADLPAAVGDFGEART